MNTYRKTAVFVGFLFIIGTVSGVLGGVISAPITAESAFPLNISASENQWLLATLLTFVMGFPLAMIPIMLYPIFRKHSEVLALGAVLFRGVLEAVCYMGMVLCNFLLLVISQISGMAEVLDPSIQTLSSLLISTHGWISLILGLVFSIGALMIYLLFYQTLMVPRWLSGWGVVGAILYFIAHVEGIFGSQQVLSFDAGLGFLMIPLAIQEMVFAVWLIVKGFNRSAIDSVAVKTATAELLSAA